MEVGCKNFISVVSCYIWGFFCRHWRFPRQQRRGGNHPYSCLPCPLAHKHSGIYLRFCNWDDHLLLFNCSAYNNRTVTQAFCFLVSMLDFTTFSQTKGGFELALTITLGLQKKQLTKFASHPLVYLLRLCFYWTGLR